MASLCPMRKILSLKRSKTNILHVAGQKTGHDLEDIVGNIVTKNFDAATELDVSLRKRIGGINFIIRGKIDLFIRKHNDNGITPTIVELKYDPLFNGEPKIEHVRQVAIYAEIMKSTYAWRTTPQVYLQYWLVQDEDLAKYTVLTGDYPEVNNPFVKTFKIENTEEIFNETLFDIARAISWAENYPGLSPVPEKYCTSCPYRRSCTKHRAPEMSKIYNAITYEKYKNNNYTLENIPKDELADAMNYIKETIKIARGLRL